MKRIAYYISDYGFGHAARSTAIIRRILLMSKDIEIIICHSFALQFLIASLGKNRIKYRNVSTDIGYFLKGNSIQPEEERIKKEYSTYINGWPQRIRTESAFLKREEIDLVISDISPIPIMAASEVGIFSIGISNFTWYTAYNQFLKEQELLHLKSAYEKMTYFFSLAASAENDWGTKGNYSFGFYSREFDQEKIEAIRHNLGANNKTLVFFGLGMKVGSLDVESLPVWDSPNVEFIVSSNININRPNVYQLSKDETESQNYIAAADLVITKAGWGTVSEAVLSNTSMLLLNRPDMQEDVNTIVFLKQNNLCETIELEELSSLKLTPKRLSNLKIEREIKWENEADSIASEIINILLSK